MERENSLKIQVSQVISFSPSFSIYSSSCRLNEIATRVVEEFRNESEINYGDVDLFPCKDEFALKSSLNCKSQERHRIEDEEKHCEDDNFEFSFMCREPEMPPISPNDQIQSVYPLFNRDFLLGHEKIRSETVSKPRRMSLGKLMMEDRDNPSCSSSESDELDGLPPGTYCIWKPKKEEGSPGKCMKSNSIGSSKPWRFRNILHRGNSDVKDSFVFLTPNSNVKTKMYEMRDEKLRSTGDGKLAGNPKTKRVSNVAAMKEDDKRREFLTYKEELF